MRIVDRDVNCGEFYFSVQEFQIFRLAEYGTHNISALGDGVSEQYHVCSLFIDAALTPTRPTNWGMESASNIMCALCLLTPLSHPLDLPTD